MASIMICLLSVLLLAAASFGQGRQPAKIPGIGFLSPGGSPGSDFRYEAFQQGLCELGYIEGRNITVEYRGAEGKVNRFQELAAELVHLKVNVIVTAASGAGVLAAKNASTTTP